MVGRLAILIGASVGIVIRAMIRVSMIATITSVAARSARHLLVSRRTNLRGGAPAIYASEHDDQRHQARKEFLPQ
jgi:hypothetical protein